MKLKFLFFFLALLLTAVWTILLVLTLKERGALFYIGEGVITFSLVFLVYFYRKVVKPLDIIGNGMELLREQDFSSRLTPVGQKEADRIVLVFNRMMEQLKDERLRLREQNHFLDLLVSASPMGVVILTLDGHISMLNAAALRFLDYSSAEEVRGRLLCELASPLAEEIERIPKDTTETIRLSDSMIYRCSRLSFVDRGFSHPFILVESLTSEVVKAEKKAYEKVIRMIAHEVNNTTAGITSTLDTGRSKRFTLSIFFLYSFSPILSCSTSFTTSSIQPESRNSNFPFAGIFTKYRYKKGLRLSSSVGSSMVATLKNRGSIFLITLPSTLPFPAVPQPSNSTSTGSPCSLICI